jgi:NAD(P)-binding Rossmann-like domain
MTYNIIIVGAGIAGLYCAFLHKKHHPESKLLILEKGSKFEIGGRMGSKPFYGSQLSIGAGIGRDQKDILLKKLLKDLGVPTMKFKTDTDMAPALEGKCDVKKSFLQIRREYIKERKGGKSVKKTFKEFSEPLLGSEAYKIFVMCSGYSDYENEDIHDTLYHYGFEDNYEEFVGIGIPWSLLLNKMITFIGPQCIKCNSTVSNLGKHGDIFSIKVKERQALYFSEKVVLATTIDSVTKLIGTKYPIYKGIQGQSFLRIYGKFSKASIPIMKEYMKAHILVVAGPIHKVITINADAGVYMIVYSDNLGADLLKRYRENTERNRTVLCHLLEKAMDIPPNSLSLIDIASFYWSIGTHYYEPLSELYKSRQEFIRKAQFPEKNLFVAGEMVALNQGWVEGALDSVEKIRDKLLLG